MSLVDKEYLTISFAQPATYCSCRQSHSASLKRECKSLTLLCSLNILTTHLMQVLGLPYTHELRFALELTDSAGQHLDPTSHSMPNKRRKQSPSDQPLTIKAEQGLESSLQIVRPGFQEPRHSMQSVIRVQGITAFKALDRLASASQHAESGQTSGGDNADIVLPCLCYVFLLSSHWISKNQGKACKA